MRRSKRFEDIFEECLELVLTRGEPIESCLSRYPEQAGELRPLLETALLTKRATAVEPSAEFRARARAQFERVLEEQPAKPKRAGFTWSWSWQPRWAAAVGVVVAVVLMSGGTVAAASRSMPGQALYPVKQATEQARIALTLSEMGKAELYVQLADRRVTEIVYLADKNDPRLVQQVTEQLDSYLDRVSELTLVAGPTADSSRGFEMAAPAATAPPAPTTAAPTTVPASSPPTDITAAVPPPITVTQPGPTTIIVGKPPVTVTQPTGKSAQGGARSADNTYGMESSARSKLASMLIYQSGNNPARLKAALANASPEVRLALLKAIAVSETGYEKALQSLKGIP
jgi:hypothetical protein